MNKTFAMRALLPQDKTSASYALLDTISLFTEPPDARHSTEDLFNTSPPRCTASSDATALSPDARSLSTQELPGASASRRKKYFARSVFRRIPSFTRARPQQVAPSRISFSAYDFPSARYRAISRGRVAQREYCFGIPSKLTCLLQDLPSSRPPSSSVPHKPCGHTRSHRRH